MALTTYILLSALHAGRAGTFDPQILGQTASKAFGLLFLEFLCIKLGCYLLGIGEEGAVVDLIAYEGYKFVGWAFLLLAPYSLQSLISLLLSSPLKPPLLDSEQRHRHPPRWLARRSRLGLLDHLPLHRLCKLLFPGAFLSVFLTLLSPADHLALLASPLLSIRSSPPPPPHRLIPFAHPPSLESSPLAPFPPPHHPARPRPHPPGPRHPFHLFHLDRSTRTER